MAMDSTQERGGASPSSVNTLSGEAFWLGPSPPALAGRTITAAGPPPSIAMKQDHPSPPGRIRRLFRLLQSCVAGPQLVAIGTSSSLGPDIVAAAQGSTTTATALPLSSPPSSLLDPLRVADFVPVMHSWRRNSSSADATAQKLTTPTSGTVPPPPATTTPPHPPPPSRPRKVAPTTLSARQVEGSGGDAQESSHPRPSNVVRSRCSEAIAVRSPMLGPQLPPHRDMKCLVLDLDETLVRSQFKYLDDADHVLQLPGDGDKTTNIYVRKRPGCDQFLQRVAKHYEVVVFTASVSAYADPLLDLLDPPTGRDSASGASCAISSRLFRESCLLLDGVYVKDLSLLGRDPQHLIIVDNSSSSYARQPANALPCGTFIDDPSDIELYVLADFLEEVALVPDCRVPLAFWSTGEYIRRWFAARTPAQWRLGRLGPVGPLSPFSPTSLTSPPRLAQSGPHALLGSGWEHWGEGQEDQAPGEGEGSFTSLVSSAAAPPPPVLAAASTGVLWGAPAGPPAAAVAPRSASASVRSAPAHTHQHHHQQQLQRQHGPSTQTPPPQTRLRQPMAVSRNHHQHPPYSSPLNTRPHSGHAPFEDTPSGAVRSFGVVGAGVVMGTSGFYDSDGSTSAPLSRGPASRRSAGEFPAGSSGGATRRVRFSGSDTPFESVSVAHASIPGAGTLGLGRRVGSSTPLPDIISVSAPSPGQPQHRALPAISLPPQPRVAWESGPGSHHCCSPSLSERSVVLEAHRSPAHHLAATAGRRGSSSPIHHRGSSRYRDYHGAAAVGGPSADSDSSDSLAVTPTPLRHGVRNPGGVAPRVRVFAPDSDADSLPGTPTHLPLRGDSRGTSSAVSATPKSTASTPTLGELVVGKGRGDAAASHLGAAPVCRQHRPESAGSGAATPRAASAAWVVGANGGAAVYLRVRIPPPSPAPARSTESWGDWNSSDLAAASVPTSPGFGTHALVGLESGAPLGLRSPLPVGPHAPQGLQNGAPQQALRYSPDTTPPRRRRGPWAQREVPSTTAAVASALSLPVPPQQLANRSSETSRPPFPSIGNTNAIGNTSASLVVSGASDEATNPAAVHDSDCGSANDYFGANSGAAYAAQSVGQPDFSPSESGSSQTESDTCSVILKPGLLPPFYVSLTHYSEVGTDGCVSPPTSNVSSSPHVRVAPTSPPRYLLQGLALQRVRSRSSNS